MKKIYTLVLAMVGFCSTQAQTIVWTGTTSTDFFDNSNWVGGVGYTGGEDILFDAGSAPCTITAGISVGSFSLLSGYTGVVDMGSTYHQLSGNLIVNSGTLISTSNVLEFGIAPSGSSSFVLGAGGTYSNNAGSVDVYSNSGTNFTFSGNIVLSTLNLNNNGGVLTLRTINFGTNLIVDDIFCTNFGARIYDFQGVVHVKNSLDLGTSSHVTNSSNNNGTFIFDGTSASIIGSTSTGAGKAYLPNIEINTSGNYSFTRSLNVRGNWVATQGTLSVGSTTVNMYGTSATISGTAAAFDNLVLQSGASVTFPASAEVNLSRSFVCTGATANFPSTTTLSFNGTTAQGITGSFTVGNIHVYTGGGRTVTLNSAIVLTDAITVDASTTFAAGTGLMTLRSNSSGTARVAQSSGTITGTAIVETFIPGDKTGWTNMGVRGVHGQSILSWDTYSVSGGLTGIPMTCVGCAYSPTVIGTGTNAFSSVQQWDEPSDGYFDITSSFNFTPGEGIWAYVGDGPTTTGNLTVINTGSLVQGFVSVPLTTTGSSSNAGFNLVANPYPSPISWDNASQISTNGFAVDASIYVWNPDLSNGAGAYASYNPNGQVSNPTGAGALTSTIAGGQGFYVFHQNLGFNTVDFDETVKLSTTSTLLKQSTSSAKLFRLKLAGLNDWDETVFCLRDEATKLYDRKFDAKKMFQTAGYSGFPGSYAKYTTISSKDNNLQDYSINTLPPLIENMIIPVLARVSSSGSYTISAFDFQDFPMCVGLIDKLDNSYHDLRLSPYVCNISDTTSAPRFELVLCKDESLNAVGVSENSESNSIFITQDAQGAYVKTVFEKNTKAIISVYNIIGQKLMQDVTVEGMVTTTSLPIDLHNQVVIIKVTTDKETVTKKMVLH